MSTYRYIGQNENGNQFPDFPQLPNLPDPVYPTEPELDELARMARDMQQISNFVHSELDRYNFEYLDIEDIQAIMDEIQNKWVPALRTVSNGITTILDSLTPAITIVDILWQRVTLMTQYVEELPSWAPAELRKSALDAASQELDMYSGYLDHYSGAVEAISDAHAANHAAIYRLDAAVDLSSLKVEVEAQKQELDEARKRKKDDDIMSDIKNVVMLGIGAVVLVSVLRAVGK